MRLKILTLAALAWAATAVADPAPPAAPASATAPDAILAYYPPAAKAAGVSGEAFLACERTEHGGLVNCISAGEAPFGQGFGDAALAFAAHAVECPDVSLAEAQRVRSTIKFTFTASPLAITPDVLKQGWMIAKPDWAKRPTVGDMSNVFPADAARTRVEGQAILTCRVTAQGRMTDCSASSEGPLHLEFAEAAMKLANLFRMSTGGPCGSSAAGATIVIPINFYVPRL